MTDGRARRRAKQIRRDARRRLHTTPTLDEHDALVCNLLREALAKKHPLGLLALVTYFIESSRPDPFARLRSRQSLPFFDRDRLITNFIGIQTSEVTALLAALAEFLDDDPILQASCRQEVARRRHHVPKWIGELRRVKVYRAARFAHVLGDIDEIVVGARFPSGYEMVCATQISHSTMSTIETAEIWSEPIADLIARYPDKENDPDMGFVDMTVADAKAWILQGMKGSTFARETDSWPQCRPLVQWLVGRMPDGGSDYAPPDWEPAALLELTKDFLASPSGQPFEGWHWREQLENIMDTGNGDPLRWSAVRVEEALDGSSSFSDDSILEVELSTPDLLRAFIPFAHARSGIREGLTAEALAAVDRQAPHFRRGVIAAAKEWGYFDDDDDGPWLQSG
ncbi:hypothetical protein [Mycolicibacterium psychrotolerans]|uniref:Uncharacterized protein n=1 Tax=Mycolicibacterium psychrotolerans TaxID=216929 RepID=A0A7I7M4U2_9MYCO|nr:hypothetical protein [Mycolicibacterium psychrotolerans]BBX66563.1 hypothetical protein MPSYJ_00240 [Mycolicibacterium psychrotolerans]